MEVPRKIDCKHTAVDAIITPSAYVETQAAFLWQASLERDSEDSCVRSKSMSFNLDLHTARDWIHEITIANPLLLRQSASKSSYLTSITALMVVVLSPAGNARLIQPNQ